MSDLVPHLRTYGLRVSVGQELYVLDGLRADPWIETVSLNGKVYPQCEPHIGARFT